MKGEKEKCKRTRAPLLVFHSHHRVIIQAKDHPIWIRPNLSKLTNPPFSPSCASPGHFAPLKMLFSTFVSTIFVTAVVGTPIFQSSIPLIHLGLHSLHQLEPNRLQQLQSYDADANGYITPPLDHNHTIVTLPAPPGGETITESRRVRDISDGSYTMNLIIQGMTLEDISSV